MHKSVTVLASLSMVWGLAFAGDAALQDCMQCHGENGVSAHDDVPTIAGASAYYLEESMLAYKDDARACPPTAYRSGDLSRAKRSMCEIAKSFSADQIRSQARFFASKPFVAAKQKFDAQLAATGSRLHLQQCERCHSDGGRAADDDAGILAGQWIGAQRFAIQDMLDGTRPTSKKMLEKLQALSKSEIDALLHFYASLQ